MLTVEKAGEIIQKEIEGLAIPKEPKKLYDPVRYILGNGGKRLRSCLVLLACDLFGADIRKAIKPALGIEVFHNFTLLHDDLMDNSIVRRGRDTVHIKWDANTAILSGDVMSILATDLVGSPDSGAVVPVSQMFNKTAIEVCEGQMLDMEYALFENVSIPQYINMIRLKTSVLIAASLGIGAIIGGASDREVESLYDFGLNLGLAFQLQDDLLDSFGDQSVFGKKIGNDILTNKRTFLLIRAFEKAKGQELDELKKYFSGEDFDPDEKIKKILNIFTLLKIKEETGKQIRTYIAEAQKDLEDLPVAAERKQVLSQFSENLLSRKK
ncbi:MAG: polyprenyl synthetase family protein [Bacteroidales bacterium]|nr:polyprenyl synthetase family protein [Bacteroidales bacterium]